MNVLLNFIIPPQIVGNRVFSPIPPFFSSLTSISNIFSSYFLHSAVEIHLSHSIIKRLMRHNLCPNTKLGSQWWLEFMSRVQPLEDEFRTPIPSVWRQESSMHASNRPTQWWHQHFDPLVGLSLWIYISYVIGL